MKLHLGCGKKYIPGFFHVDIISYPHVDHVGPVDELPFAEGSCRLIYACHVLEHFGRHEVFEVLCEWHRVLGPGGQLRLAVPNFAAVAKLYHEGLLADGIEAVMGLMVGGQRDQWDHHKTIFDEVLLTRLCIDAGFDHVRWWDWRTTEHADVDDYSQAYLPHLDKERGHLMSLNLEATRG